MKIECMVLGAVATNCYFVINEETKETIVIDPADRAAAVITAKRKAYCFRETLCSAAPWAGPIFRAEAWEPWSAPFQRS